MNKREALTLLESYKASVRQGDPFYSLKSPLRKIGIGKNRAFSLLKHYLQSLILDIEEANATGFIHYLSQHGFIKDMELFEGGIPTDADKATQDIFAAVFTPRKVSTVSTALETDEGEANIDEFPQAWLSPRPPLNTSTQLTIGDLHGNALKLIYFLIREKVLTGISEADYHELVKIYKTPTSELSKAQLNQFAAILAKVTANPVGLIKLIGDTLSDRGSNDYFTLAVLAKLQQLKVPVEILASNHDVEYLVNYQADDSSVRFTSGRLIKDQARSLQNLQELLKKFPSLESEVKTITESCFIPAVKLISYSLNQDESTITLFTHAPVGMKEIESLAERFTVKFNAKTAKDLAHTIDAINQAVTESGGIAQLYNELFAQQSLAEASRLHIEILQAFCTVLQLPCNHATEEETFDTADRINATLMQLNENADAIMSKTTAELLSQQEIVTKLCAMFQVSYRAATQAEFEHTLNELRFKLTQTHPDNPNIQLNRLIPRLSAVSEVIINIKRNFPLLCAKAIEADPLYLLIWNRDYDGLERPACYTPGSASKAYPVNFVHGHDHSMVIPSHRHVVCLDNDLGKYDPTVKYKHHKGPYRVLYTYAHTPKPLLASYSSSDDEVSSQLSSPSTVATDEVYERISSPASSVASSASSPIKLFGEERQSSRPASPVSFSAANAEPLDESTRRQLKF